MRWIIFIIFLSCLAGQSKYPADTLLASQKVSLISKIGVLPIAAWQRISYNTSIFNCQFYPSCSNYGAEAMRQFGLIRGGAMASERIVRCNPFAFHYHLDMKRPFHASDGRLIDTVHQSEIVESDKSPLLAATMSVVLPGSGRMYAGRFLDGLMGLWTFYLVGNAAYKSIKYKRPIAGPLFGLTAALTYLGEIYGGWRTAKYYQAIKQQEENTFKNSD